MPQPAGKESSGIKYLKTSADISDMANTAPPTQNFQRTSTWTIVDTAWMLAASAYLSFVLGEHASLRPDQLSWMIIGACCFALAAQFPVPFTKGRQLVSIDFSDGVILTSAIFLSRFDLLCVIVIGCIVSIRFRKGTAYQQLIFFCDRVVMFVPIGLLAANTPAPSSSEIHLFLVGAGAAVAIPNFVYNVLSTSSIRLTSLATIGVIRLLDTAVSVAMASVAVSLITASPWALIGLTILLASLIGTARGSRAVISLREQLSWLEALPSLLESDPNTSEDRIILALHDFFPHTRFVLLDNKKSPFQQCAIRLHADNEDARYLVALEPTSNSPYRLTSEDIAYITSIERLIGQAHNLHQNAEDLRQATLRDSLTDLPNGRLLTELITQAIHNAARAKTHAAVFVVNVDDFSAINATYGHEIGDQVLTEIAVRLRESLRTNDIVARIGNDEFVVLLPTTRSKSDAEHVVVKIMHALEQPLEPLQGTCIETSVGVALYPERGTTAKELLFHAHNALLSAKNSEEKWVFSSNADQYRFRGSPSVDWQHEPDPSPAA